MLSLATISLLLSLTNAQSLPNIEFKSLTSAKHLFQSQQENTNANILEKAYCKFNTFQDATTKTDTFYHWYTQTISNYTSVTALDDELNAYSNPNNNISKQIPHQIYYSYSSFDACLSPTTNDIFTCYVVPSCCFGCAFIECNIFFNDGSNPTWSDLNFFITGNEGSGSFAQKPQVSCMNDGYIVSWIYAKRQGPPSKDCDNKNNIGDNMVFSNYMIQYGTIDLNGNMKLSNETLLKFDTFDLVTAVNNFEVMTMNNSVHMTFGYNITQGMIHSIQYLNVSDFIVEYQGIDKKLTLQDIDYCLYDGDSIYLNEYQNVTTTYKSIIIDVTDYCCIVNVLKTPFYDNPNVHINWYVDIRYLNGTHVTMQSGGKQVGFVDVIELTMFNKDELNGKYFAMIYDDIPHSINVGVFYLNYTKNWLNPIQLLNVGDMMQLIGNDSNAMNNNYSYSFCSNILPNSTNIIMSWAQNPYTVNEITNVYIQSWHVVMS